MMIERRFLLRFGLVLAAVVGSGKTRVLDVVEVSGNLPTRSLPSQTTNEQTTSQRGYAFGSHLFGSRGYEKSSNRRVYGGFVGGNPWYQQQAHRGYQGAYQANCKQWCNEGFQQQMQQCPPGSQPCGTLPNQGFQQPQTMCPSGSHPCVQQGNQGFQQQCLPENMPCIQVNQGFQQPINQGFQQQCPSGSVPCQQQGSQGFYRQCLPENMPCIQTNQGFQQPINQGFQQQCPPGSIPCLQANQGFQQQCPPGSESCIQINQGFQQQGQQCPPGGGSCIQANQGFQQQCPPGSESCIQPNQGFQQQCPPGSQMCATQPNPFLPNQQMCPPGGASCIQDVNQGFQQQLCPPGSSQPCVQQINRGFQQQCPPGSQMCATHPNPFLPNQQMCPTGGAVSCIQQTNQGFQQPFNQGFQQQCTPGSQGCLEQINQGFQQQCLPGSQGCVQQINQGFQQQCLPGSHGCTQQINQGFQQQQLCSPFNNQPCSQGLQQRRFCPSSCRARGFGSGAGYGTGFGSGTSIRHLPPPPTSIGGGQVQQQHGCNCALKSDPPGVFPGWLRDKGCNANCGCRKSQDDYCQFGFWRDVQLVHQTTQGFRRTLPVNAIKYTVCDRQANNFCEKYALGRDRACFRLYGDMLEGKNKNDNNYQGLRFTAETFIYISCCRGDRCAETEWNAIPWPQCAARQQRRGAYFCSRRTAKPSERTCLFGNDNECRDRWQEEKFGDCEKLTDVDEYLLPLYQVASRQSRCQQPQRRWPQQNPFGFRPRRFQQPCRSQTSGFGQANCATQQQPRGAYPYPMPPLPAAGRCQSSFYHAASPRRSNQCYMDPCFYHGPQCGAQGGGRELEEPGVYQGLGTGGG